MILEVQVRPLRLASHPRPATRRDLPSRFWVDVVVDGFSCERNRSRKRPIVLLIGESCKEDVTPLDVERKWTISGESNEEFPFGGKLMRRLDFSFVIWRRFKIVALEKLASVRMTDRDDVETDGRVHDRRARGSV